MLETQGILYERKRGFWAPFENIHFHPEYFDRSILARTSTAEMTSTRSLGESVKWCKAGGSTSQA